MKLNLKSIKLLTLNIKTIVFVFLSLFVFVLHSQMDTRYNISGEILVEGNDLAGITIFNKTHKKGTITDNDGKFVIAVKENDVLQIRALKYQDFDVVVSATTMASKRLKIILIQEITALEEIVVHDRTFTGNIKTDIKAIKTFKPDLDAIYFGVKQEPKLNESLSAFARNDIAISNATAQNKPLVNGLNLINVVDQLLLPLFRAEVKDKKKVGLSEVPVEQIKYYFGSEFLSDNFGIPKHRVEEFIRFVEDNNFDFSLLNYGREIEFLELISKKSTLFLNKKR